MKEVIGTTLVRTLSRTGRIVTGRHEARTVSPIPRSSGVFGTAEHLIEFLPLLMSETACAHVGAASSLPETEVDLGAAGTLGDDRLHREHARRSLAPRLVQGPGSSQRRASMNASGSKIAVIASALLVATGAGVIGTPSAAAAPTNTAAIGAAARPLSPVTLVACAVRRVCSRGVCRSVRSCAPVCAVRRVCSGGVCRSVRSCG